MTEALKTASLFNIKDNGIFWGFGALTIILSILSFVLELHALLAIPFITLFMATAIYDYKKIWYLLFFFIPLSMEVEIGDALATDLPTEFIIITLFLILGSILALRPSSISRSFLRHPIIKVLTLHTLWIGITAIYATEFLVALKYWIAKLWYVGVFILLASIMIKDLKNIKTIFWLLFFPAIFTVVQTLIRHWQFEFSFLSVNNCVTPYFRNHVNYAAFLVLFYPFIFLARTWYSRNSIIRIFIDFGNLLFLVAIYLSYTRAAWICVVVMMVAFFLIKKRIFIPAMILGILCVGLFISFLIKDNKYLSFAPEYSKTIYHENISDHLESTVSFEDISTAERFYRWAAAMQMSKARPFLGFGPGNFYFNYKKYAVSDFTTYVSGNEEKSGVHNYFLMTLIEQGYIGLSIFFVLTFMIFYIGQKIYLKLVKVEDKNLIIAVLLSLVSIVIMNFFSDLIETDKVGIFFFLNIAILVLWDLPDRQIGLKAKHSYASE